MELASRSQVRVPAPAPVRTPPGRPAFCVRPSSLFGAGNVALCHRVADLVSLAPGTPDRARPAGVRGGSARWGPGWKSLGVSRTAVASVPGGSPGVAGRAGGAASPWSGRVSREAQAGSSRGVASAFAALVDLAWRGGRCAGSFFGALPPLSPGIGTEMRKFQKSVIFLKK